MAVEVDVVAASPNACTVDTATAVAPSATPPLPPPAPRRSWVATASATAVPPDRRLPSEVETAFALYTEVPSLSARTAPKPNSVSPYAVLAPTALPTPVAVVMAVASASPGPAAIASASAWCRVGSVGRND